MSRLLAFLVDQVLLGLAAIFSALALNVLGPLGLGLWFILVFFLQWLYPVFCETLAGGRTLGKRWLGLRVLMADGRPVGWMASLIRNLLRVVDILPGSYTVGFISMLVTRDFQRIGDLVAGTLVVHDPVPVPAPTLPDMEPRVPPRPLAFEDQAALLAFAERSPGLTPTRCEELTDLLKPLTGRTGPEGFREVLAMARYLWGGP
ncbi:RDD family protein [Mesoterricola silvestris]|uniref:RDD family protein n=1 Tax=Mesoterricola silvestris TaxID=2927979 RepID=UPI00292FA346|nr:RDD family protein [Mesoterricola silvestris]